MQLSHLRRDLISILLILGLCVTVTGTSIAWTHARNVSAAARLVPTFSVNVAGTTYVAQYVKSGFSNQQRYSYYSDFGVWNFFTFSPGKKWFYYGQFSGHQDVYYNGHGKVQGAMDIRMPGVGRIDTYSHNQIAVPSLSYPSFAIPPADASRFHTVGPTYIGGETLLGTRMASEPIANNFGETFKMNDCQIYPGNFAGGGSYGTRTADLQTSIQGNGSTEYNDCQAGNIAIEKGEAAIDSLYNRYANARALQPNANGPVVASLNRPTIALPVALGAAGGIFFIAAGVTGAICSFATCHDTTKKVLAGIALGLAIISGTLGLVVTLMTAAKVFDRVAPPVLPQLPLFGQGILQGAASVYASAASSFREEGQEMGGMQVINLAAGEVAAGG